MIMVESLYLRDHVTHVIRTSSFLTTTWQNKKRHRCCNVCKDLVDIQATSDKYDETPYLPPPPARVPIMMAIFAGFGVLLMIAGLAYVVLVAPSTGG